MKLAAGSGQGHQLTTRSGSSLFFFFSSRRRHTRCSRDWSSDVCSSDLVIQRDERNRGGKRAAGMQALVNRVAALLDAAKSNVRVLDRQQVKTAAPQEEIGRASCRERV